jgi:hypothetical protein
MSRHPISIEEYEQRKEAKSADLAKYSEDQLRDENGMWTTMRGRTVGRNTYGTGHATGGKITDGSDFASGRAVNTNDGPKKRKGAGGKTNMPDPRDGGMLIGDNNLNLGELGNMSEIMVEKRAAELEGFRAMFGDNPKALTYGEREGNRQGAFDIETTQWGLEVKSIVIGSDPNIRLTRDEINSKVAAMEERGKKGAILAVLHDYNTQTSYFSAHIGFETAASLRSGNKSGFRPSSQNMIQLGSLEWSDAEMRSYLAMASAGMITKLDILIAKMKALDGVSSGEADLEIEWYEMPDGTWNAHIHPIIEDVSWVPDPDGPTHWSELEGVA